METRKVSSEKLIECIHGLDTNEVSNVSACMRLANEHIDAIDIASLFMEESATITLKQAELIIGIRKAFNFICDEYDFNDCAQLIITLGKFIGMRTDEAAGDLIIGETGYRLWKSCNAKDKTVMERAIAWFASIVYYEPFEDMNEIIAYLMFNKVLIENGAGYATMSYVDVAGLKTVIKQFKSGEFSEHPEQLSQVLTGFVTIVG